jgi:putative membrane protein
MAMLSQCPWFGGGSPWFWLVPLGMFALFLLVVLVFWRRGGVCCGPWGGRDSQPSALDILKQRYARGEINKDEFDRMKKDIED